MEKLQSIFENIDKLSKTCDSKFQVLNETIHKQTEKQQSDDHYLLMRDRYKRYIESFSPSYIQMSEFYIGPELTREKYQRIFQPTYLDSKEDVKELYKLFVFYLLIERMFS